MKQETVIKVENIGKKYKIGEREKYLAMRDTIVNTIKLPYHLLTGQKSLKKPEIWALKDVSFEVEKGEVIGIIGSNGAGKSTLLKIITKITEPTAGKITIKGRVASLLEVGTGFHLELTGRENIYLNGAVLGMKKKEIEFKFNDIIEFAGIGKFIDTPVKRYSSGMYVRLAFAVAAHLEPDIMLVDEVLAVGDVEFQRKCLDKMDEVTKKAGRTILFVSHNMPAVQSLCKRCVLLEDGKVKMVGETNKVVKSYLNENSVFIFKKGKNKEIQITKLSILNKDNVSVTKIPINQDFFIEIDYEVYRYTQDAIISVMFFSSTGELLLFSTETDKKFHLLDYNPGRYKTKVRIQAFLFNIGHYSFDVSVQHPLVKHLTRGQNIKFEIIDASNSKLYREWRGLGEIATILDYNTVKKVA